MISNQPSNTKWIHAGAFGRWFIQLWPFHFSSSQLGKLQNRTKRKLCNKKNKFPGGYGSLAHEVDDNDVQHDVSEDEVSEASFRWNSRELRFVLGIRLQTEANCEDEAADSRDEAGEEWIERECANENAVRKLQNTRQQDVNEISIDQLQLLWRVVLVFIVELG